MNKYDELTTAEPILILKLNKEYRPGMSSDELYEASRKYWVTGSRREKVKYAVASYHGQSLEVYRIDEWYEVEFRGKKRWAFRGVVASDDIRDELVSKSIRNLNKKGASNPVRYMNC